MKKDGKYRFSLQFGSETEEQRNVGELLERLGNRKSTVIVAAVEEYMNKHPELLGGENKIVVRISSGVSRDEVELMLQSMVDKKLASLRLSESTTPEGERPTEEPDDNISEMLDNLDYFI